MFLNFIFRNKRKFSILVLILLLDMFVFSQIQESNNSELLSSEYRLPLFALDSSGKPFYNLKKEDLELYINGKLVKTVNLKKFLFLKERESTETVAVNNEQEIILKKPERIFFIVIDAMFCSNYGVKRSREIAAKLVENASAGDSFVLLVNSARNGLIHVIGPEKKTEVVMKKIEKSNIFPGSEWFKDTFSRRDSFMDRFSAESDYEFMEPKKTENTASTLKKQYGEQVKKFDLKVTQVRYAFQMIAKPKIVYLFSEGFRDDEFVDKFYDPSKAEVADAVYSANKLKLENLDFSSIIFEYFKKLIKALKEGGNIIYSINPGKLKTMNYNPSGAMQLQFLTAGERNFFQGLNTEKIIKSILNATAAYFELIYYHDSVSGYKQKIEVKCNRKDVYVHTPSLKIEKTYQQMNINQKKMYALSIVTEGILGKIVGRTEKVNYSKNIKKTKDRLYKYTIEVQPPERMQNFLTDIFMIVMDKKTKKWNIKMINKIISDQEKLTFVLKNKKNYDLYLAFINTSTADSIYNKII